MVHDKRPQETEVLVELVHGHGPTGARTATASSSGATGPGGASSSDLAAGLSASSADSRTKPVHASTIGAYLDDDDDDDDDDDEDAEGVEEEDDAEQSTDDEEEEEEEEEDGLYTSAAVTIHDTDVEMDDAAAAAGISEPKRVKRKHATPSSGGRRTAKGAHTEPSPPKSFLFVDEEEGNLQSQSQPTRGVTTTTTSSTAAPSHEPMDVDQGEHKKPSEGDPKNSSSKPKEPDNS